MLSIISFLAFGISIGLTRVFNALCGTDGIRIAVSTFSMSYAVIIASLIVATWYTQRRSSASVTSLQV